MSDKTPTAVGWLVEQKTKYHQIINVDLEHALTMEKQQIIDAYSADRFPCSEEDAEQYYIENYGK
jgi:hypothetical protein